MSDSPDHEQPAQDAAPSPTPAPSPAGDAQAPGDGPDKPPRAAPAGSPTAVASESEKPRPRAAPAKPTTEGVKPVHAGAAVRLARGSSNEQEPLVGSADLGWNVFNAAMTVGLIALAVITVVSCFRMVRVLLAIL